MRKYSQVALYLAMSVCCEFRQGEIYLEAGGQTLPVPTRGKSISVDWTDFE